MPGFLSTPATPLARLTTGATGHRTANSGDLQLPLKAGKKGNPPNFHSAFAKTDRVSPAAAGGPSKKLEDRHIVQGESNSVEQVDADSVEDASLDSPHDSQEEAAVGISEPGQLDLEDTEIDQDDPEFNGSVESQVFGPVPVATRQAGAIDSAGASIDIDVIGGAGLAAVTSRPTAAAPNGSADMGPKTPEGARQSSFAGSSIGETLLQSAHSDESDSGSRVASSPQVLAATIQQTLQQADPAALSGKPNSGGLAHSSRPEVSMMLPPNSDHAQLAQREISPGDGTIRLCDGIISQDAKTTLTMSAAPSADLAPPDMRRSATEGNTRTAITTATDAMRSAQSTTPEPNVTIFTPIKADGEDRGQPFISSDDPLISGDPRPAQLTNAELRMSTVANGGAPQMARHVAIQLSQAAMKGESRPIDLALNPSELGRVRITLTSGDAGMMVSLSAERQETLDMMRRHIDVLDQEFRDLGYDGTNFTFSQEQGGTQHIVKEGMSEGPSSDDVLGSVTNSDALQNSAVLRSDRLDIRL